MAAREERAVEELLLPETADGLRRLVRRSMHRPPPWMPDFVLDDFIKCRYPPLRYKPKRTEWCGEHDKRNGTEDAIKFDDDLLMLGIETSCDDTAAAVVRGDGEILSQVVSSQEDLLVRWGGVAPKMAEEAHSLAIDQVVQKALDDANVSENDLSAVAVTVGPGLSLCLRDDAIGEAYDKSARWLGLDIRKGGGPALEQLALEGDPNAVKFSVPMRQHKDCNFSYAGLKTQVRLAIESRNISTDDIPISSATRDDRQIRANIAASFQRVAVLHLEERCQRAVEWALKMEPSIKYFVVSGGVASNQYVRTHLNQIAEKNGLQLVCPPPRLCTDNGVMIAWTGIEHFIAGRFDDPPAVDEPDDMQYDLRPRWPLGEEYSEGRSASRSMKTARVHPSLTSMIQGSVH
uniref:N(6)-L-threonylcarbamoyladenine synthase n=1 Tax=Oryza glumipatula TaxID=40148 RepID=A0A0E0BST3_9ORYZ